MTGTNEYLLQLKDVSKTFGSVKALKNVSMEVKYGEVHCLVGENGSGKSTLIRSVSGVQDFESGSIILNGNVYQRSLKATHAMKEGVQVIYQDLSLFPNLTVAENIAFTYLTENRKMFVKKSMYSNIAKKGLDLLKYTIDLDDPVEHLSMASRQIVAIARALVMDAKLIIMDEPTTALTKKEIDQLLSIILFLKQHSISTIFVSHKLDEVFKVADNITVLRDGMKIGDFSADELDERKLSYYMTGRDIDYDKFTSNATDKTPPVVSINKAVKEPHFRNISFSICPGEVVGLTGPIGAGRTELALALFGLNPISGGEILIEGKKITITSPQVAIKKGIGLVPEDRHKQGLFLQQTLTTNIVSTILYRLASFGIINSASLTKNAERYFQSLKIKAPSINTTPRELSGGNQQRVVIGKWLATNPKLLILDSPTVGIDVGSKSEIHSIIHELAHKGMAILMISDEIPEVYNNCNRILIMRDGDLIGDFDQSTVSEEQLRNLVERGVQE